MITPELEIARLRIAITDAQFALRHGPPAAAQAILDAALAPQDTLDRWARRDEVRT